LETNIQSIKHLHQVNLKTQENWQRDTIFTSLKLNATLINPLELNWQSLKIKKKTMSQYWRSTRWYCVLVFENEKENKISQCRWHCAGIENQKKSLNSTTTALR
jgi:hypothetical protein